MFRFAAANLASRPGRTSLAILGLTIAIAGMVGLFAIAGGIDHMLEASLGRIPGVVVMQPGAPIPMFSTLPAAWGEEMAAIEGVDVVNPEIWTRVNILDGESVFSPPRLLLGADIASRVRLKQGVYASAIKQGRFLNERDVGRPRVLISRQIAGDLDKTVGDRVDVNGREMEVVGIYHTGSLLVDVTVVADITIVRQLARIDPDTVSCFYLEPHDGISSDAITQRVQRHFAGREPRDWRPSGLTSAMALPPLTLRDWLARMVGVRKASPPHTGDSAQHTDQLSEPGDSVRRDSGTRPGNPTIAHTKLLQSPQEHPLEVHSVADWGDRFSELATDLDLVLALLTGLGVLIAVSSILNTMMMSVSERMIEFGILRANGWSQADVVKLILVESSLVGVAGGLLGITCGWAASQLINTVWSDRVLLYAGPLLLSGSLIFSIFLGALGGLYPAYRAARMSPMAAIRRW